MNHWQKINTNDLWELVIDLERRARDCREMAAVSRVHDRINRLGAKATTYEHAADLLADELRKLGA